LLHHKTPLLCLLKGERW